MVREISLGDVRGLIGEEVGLSDWIRVDQTMIQSFADATDDHQFIHVDPDRAALTPFGGTIAHGFLTLSLLSTMNFNCLPKVREQTMAINYGFDAVRFVNPVKVNSRIRGRFKLAEARFRAAGMLMITYDVSIEIEGEKKPALTAKWIVVVQFDPADRPSQV
jgi:acyl dehydratase